MSLLCWNCHGLGLPRTVRALHGLVSVKRPAILFLSEMKQRKSNTDAIRRRLGFPSCFAVERVGLAGGLLLCWFGDAQVNIQSYFPGHIDAIVKVVGCDQPWRFTGFYRNPEISLQKNSWLLLSRLCDLFSGPWICGGDFNEILVNLEKWGGNVRPLSQMDALGKF